MDYKAAGELFRGVTTRPKWAGFGVVTPLMWPGYKRITSAKGGDVSASWSFTGRDHFLQYWLEEGLGQHFIESWEGRPSFMGIVEEVKLLHPRISFVASLEPVANKIAAYYTSVVTGTTQITAFVEDQDSIDQWGERILILRPADYMDQTEAEDWAAAVLAERAQPRINRGPVQAGNGRAARVQIKVRGYASTLDLERYDDPIDGTEAISTQIQNVLAGSGFVAAGSISSNTVAVSTQAELRPKLQRIHWLADRRDASGNQYYYGCFASRTFDYAPVPAGIKYDTWTAGAEFYVSESGSGFFVPPPLVRPGGRSFARDVMPAVPFSGEADYRVQWDAVAEYGDHGVALKGEEWRQVDRTEALGLAILAQRGS